MLGIIEGWRTVIIGVLFLAVGLAMVALTDDAELRGMGMGFIINGAAMAGMRVATHTPVGVQRGRE